MAKVSSLVLWALLFLLLAGSQLARSEHYYVSTRHHDASGRGDDLQEVKNGDPNTLQPEEWQVRWYHTHGKGRHQWGAGGFKTYQECQAHIEKTLYEARHDKDFWFPDWYEDYIGPIAIMPTEWTKLVKDAGPMPTAAASLVYDDLKTQIGAAWDIWKNGPGDLDEVPAADRSKLQEYYNEVKAAKERVEKLKELIDRNRTLNTLTNDVQRYVDDTRDAVYRTTNRQTRYAPAAGQTAARWSAFTKVKAEFLATRVVDLSSSGGYSICLTLRNTQNNAMSFQETSSSQYWKYDNIPDSTNIKPGKDVTFLYKCTDARERTEVTWVGGIINPTERYIDRVYFQLRINLRTGAIFVREGVGGFTVNDEWREVEM